VSGKLREKGAIMGFWGIVGIAFGAWVLWGIWNN
jgi:hypothetical protein